MDFLLGLETTWFPRVQLTVPSATEKSLKGPVQLGHTKPVLLFGEHTMPLTWGTERKEFFLSQFQSPGAANCPQGKEACTVIGRSLAGERRT